MYFEIDGSKIYYEVHGQGEPLVLLNGIMMSTVSWAPFVEDLSKYNKLILVDFLDQGKSDKIPGVDYDLALQVKVVEKLLEELKLKSVNLFGVSYGSEVALQFTVEHSEKVKRLIVFNSAASTGYWLREIGEGWNRASEDPLNYYYATIPYIYSPMFYVERESWMEKRKEYLEGVFSNERFIQAMKRLTNSAKYFNIEKELRKINCPTLILGSQYDFVTPYAEQEKLNKGIKNSQLIYLPNCGHASMYEKPKIFATLLLGFINTHDEYNI